VGYGLDTCIDFINSCSIFDEQKFYACVGKCKNSDNVSISNEAYVEFDWRGRSKPSRILLVLLELMKRQLNKRSKSNKST